MSASGTMRFVLSFRSGTALSMIWKVGPTVLSVILGCHGFLDSDGAEGLAVDECEVVDLDAGGLGGEDLVVDDVDSVLSADELDDESFECVEVLVECVDVSVECEDEESVDISVESEEEDEVVECEVVECEVVECEVVECEEEDEVALVGNGKGNGGPAGRVAVGARYGLFVILCVAK
jgi:hypothetical protein